MVTVGFILTPAVVFSVNNAGGIGGLLGSKNRYPGGVAGAITLSIQAFAPARPFPAGCR